MAGKGDRNRIKDLDKYAKNWDKIFNKKTKVNPTKEKNTNEDSGTKSNNSN